MIRCSIGINIAHNIIEWFISIQLFPFAKIKDVCLCVWVCFIAMATSSCKVVNVFIQIILKSQFFGDCCISEFKIIPELQLNEY